MPSPSGTFTPFALPPALTGQPTAVFRYGGGVFSPLPTVKWVEIEYRKGPYPPRATFRYAYRADGTPAAPFEAVLPIVKSSTTADTIYLDDRLVVATVDDTGAVSFLFDGFVQIPEASISGQSYDLTFQAQGVAIRCWDAPLVGSWRRDAYYPDNLAQATWCQGISGRINPDGKPNATGGPTGAAYDYTWPEPNLPGQYSPLFFDARYPTTRGDLHPFLPYAVPWTLGMAARYLLAAGNGLQLWVANPDFSAIDATLQSINVDGTTSPICCKDTVISGTPWPEALHEAIRSHGFTFTFRLGNAGGLPYNYLTFERERDGIGSPIKSLYLQPPATTIDPSRSNAKAFDLAVDGSQIVNAYYVDHKADEYEIGVVLAPGFAIDVVNDALHPEKWLASNPDPAADRDRYRLFLADECGEGHWFLSAGRFQANFPFKQFTQLWGPEWVVRRRPGYGPCFTLDSSGNRRKPQLAVLTNWGKAGGADPPLLFDKTVVPCGKPGSNPATIVPVKGSWELLHDRLGVRLTMPDPTQWNIGAIDPSNPAYSALNGGVINLLQNYQTFSEHKPGAHLYLLLTCVVEADRKTNTALATRQPTSPTAYQVARYVDGHDRYRRWAVHSSSSFQSGNSGLYGTNIDDPRARYYCRDDSAAAQAYAEAMRASTETPSMGGTVTIGRLTNQYFVGDRVDAMMGRMNLQTNTPGSPTPRYPMIVQLTWRQEPEQATVLQLDDRRSESDPVEV
jgi:hypothetical protein